MQAPCQSRRHAYCVAIAPARWDDGGAARGLRSTPTTLIARARHFLIARMRDKERRTRRQVCYIPHMSNTLSSRIMARVRKDEETGCWVWLGCISGKGYEKGEGYGRIQAVLGKLGQVSTHRVMYEQHKGPIPPGLQIDHLCRNRRCCNPDHLEAVTQKENIMRGISFSAHNARKTACPRGHEYTSDNVVWDVSRGDRRRKCRECERLRAIRNRRRAAALRQAA